MRLNRILQRAKWRATPDVLLRERASAARHKGRPILVLVPPCFGVAMLDPQGDAIWGSKRQLFFGRHFFDGRRAAHSRLLAEFSIVPGVFGYDVLGGYVDYLEHIGGYRMGEDLFVFLYDWRSLCSSAGEQLREFLGSLAGAGSCSFDLIALSSGAPVVRSYLAEPSARQHIRRVVYVCGPQRGSLSAFEYIQLGLQFVRLGRTFRNIESIDSAYELLPHPDDAGVVDRGGQSVPLSFYDPALWRDHKLVGHRQPELEARLAHAEAFHRRLDAATSHPSAWVIGDRRAQTPRYAVLDRGKLAIPACACDHDSKLYPFAYGPGDGRIAASSVEAVPGRAGEPWWTDTAAHHELAKSPGVRRLTVEALIAPDKPIVRDLYRLRSPADRRRASTEATHTG